MKKFYIFLSYFKSSFLVRDNDIFLQRSILMLFFSINYILNLTRSLGKVKAKTDFAASNELVRVQERQKEKKKIGEFLNLICNYLLTIIHSYLIKKFLKFFYLLEKKVSNEKILYFPILF